MMSSCRLPKHTLLAVLFAMLTLASWPSASVAQQQPQQPQRILAPELEGGVGWIGIDKPLRLKDLRGKIVVFDFWTLC